MFAVNRRKPIDRFQFDQQLIADQQVGTEARVDSQFAISDRNELLPLDCQSSLHKDVRQHGLISRFQQTRPKLLMNLQPCIDRDRGHRFDIHPALFAFFAFFA